MDKKYLFYILAEAKLYLPENITELHLQNNKLTNIPPDSITNATQLRILDVRHNEMTSFEPAIVKKIINTGLEVFFEGKCILNTLKNYLHLILKTINLNYIIYLKNFTYFFKYT